MLFCDACSSVRLLPDICCVLFFDAMLYICGKNGTRTVNAKRQTCEEATYREQSKHYIRTLQQSYRIMLSADKRKDMEPLADDEKRKALEPLFSCMIVPPMMLQLPGKVESVSDDEVKVTVGSCVFSEVGKLCLCLNRDTRRRVLDCMKNHNGDTFMAAMQAWTRKFINSWIWDHTRNHCNVHIDNDRFVFRLKAHDMRMPTDDDSEHSVVRIVAMGHRGSSGNFEYSEKTAMVDFCVGLMLQEDVNMHLTRMMEKTQRFFESRAREQEDEANNNKRRKLGNFATPKSF